MQRPLIAFAGMPRYFFHVKRGRATVVDKVGLELADLDEALEETGRLSGKLLRGTLYAPRHSSLGRSSLLKTGGQCSSCLLSRCLGLESGQRAVFFAKMQIHFA